MNGNADEIERRRDDQAYNENPIVITIRELLSDSDCWFGTTTELTNEVFGHTGQYLGPANRATKKVREIIPDLVKRDNLKITTPNKNGGTKGRVFTFEKKAL